MRLVFSFCLCLLVSFASLADEPEYINDRAIRQAIVDRATELADAGETIDNSELQEKLASDFTHLAPPPEPFTLTRDGEDLYDSVDDGVLVIARLYLCGKCDNLHANCATGFVIGKDGLAVTNHHVMRNTDEKTRTFVAMTRSGRVVPIVDVLAADRKNDLALVRLAGEGFSPVPIARSAQVGERVHAVTNPSGRFFSYSSGEIARFFIKPKHRGVKRVTVSCDYGGGSSGGPIFNDQGQVVAVVSEAAVVKDKKIVHYDSVPYESVLGLFDLKDGERGEDGEQVRQ